MAIEKKIKITADVNDATKEVDKLGKSLKNVDKEADKAGKSVDDVAGNGGAIAILDQLTGGLATRLRDAYEASKLFNVSLKGTSKALIATGIGAFVVILGTVVAYWDDIVELIGGANKKLQEQIDNSIKIQESLKIQVSLIDKQIELSTRQGKANEELQKQRLAILKSLREENDAEIKKLELQAQTLKTSALELTTREKILKATLNTIRAGSGDQFILDKQIESLNRFKEIQDLITKAKTEQVDIDLKLFDLNNKKEEEDKPSGKREVAKSVSTLDLEGRTQEEFDAQLQRDLERKSKENEIIQGQFDFKKSMRELELQEEKERADKQAKIEEELTEKVNNAKQSALDNTIKIAGEDTKVGKALLVAKQALLAKELIMEVSKTITFSSQAAARSVVAVAEGTAQTAKVGFPQNIPLLIGYAAQAAGIISAITSATSKAGASVSGGRGASVPSTPAPSFNLVQGTGSNQIAESLQTTQEPVRAYVVSSEVTTSQSLDRNIEENATI